MTTGPAEIAEMLSRSHATVVFTGAGMSTESGIPDFRSPGGIWTKYQPVMFQDFISSASARHDYWTQKSEGHRDFAQAKPNVGHALLAEWEKDGHVSAVITQNIDGLHQQAGSQRVLELHGTAREVSCLSCDYRHDADEYVTNFLEQQTVPDCPQCGGLLKHATISFGQALPISVMEESQQLCLAADLIMVLGTSLTVRPAADLPHLAVQQGAKLVIINRTSTHLDSRAANVIHAGIGESLESIATAMA